MDVRVGDLERVEAGHVVQGVQVPSAMPQLQDPASGTPWLPGPASRLAPRETLVGSRLHVELWETPAHRGRGHTSGLGVGWTVLAQSHGGRHQTQTCSQCSFTRCLFLWSPGGAPEARAVAWLLLPSAPPGPECVWGHPGSQSGCHFSIRPGHPAALSCLGHKVLPLASASWSFLLQPCQVSA